MGTGRFSEFGRRLLIGGLRNLPAIVLGGLTAAQIGSKPAYIVAGALAALLLVGLGLVLLRGLIYLASPKARAQVGYEGIKTAIARGFVMLLPFAVLAAVAELLLGWNAVLAFAAAGLMTSATAAGSELAGIGGERLRCMVLPSLVAFGLAIAWTLLSALGAAFVGGTL